MLNIGSDYSVFKSDIKPMWEDMTNKNGGRWLIKNNGLLDQHWIDIVLFFLYFRYYLCVKYLYLFLVVKYDWWNV